MQTIKEIPQSEKIKIAQKGKLLNAEEVEFAAIKHFGIRSYRQKIAKILDCSDTLIFYAFNNKAPFVLYKINEIVNNNINAVDKDVNTK